MKNTISEQTKKSVGLNFVLENLTADSPFGAEKIKNIEFYTQAEKPQLERELYNISRALLIAQTEQESLNTLRRLLMRFKNIRNILNKCQSTYLHEIEFFDVKSFLLTFTKTFELFNAINAKALFDGICLVDLENCLDILDFDKKRIAPFHLNDKLSEKLWAVRQEKAQIEHLLHVETDAATVEKLKLERLCIVAREQDEETEIKKQLSKQIAPYVPTFFANMEELGKLDFTIQKALLALRYDAVCPEISADNDLVLENMTNPEISSFLSVTDKNFTPISIALKNGTTILTGANMGGKSVALKTTVLNVLLAQAGFFVFAQKAVIPLFDDVFIVSEDLQNISLGLSTFGAEIVKLNEIVKRAKNEFLLIALDEFARGTNPHEGANIVKSVASFLNELSSVTLMTTHYDNIVSPEFQHFQVVGLANVNFNLLQNIVDADLPRAVSLIAQNMDYSIQKVTTQKEPPKDALNICKLLGLDLDIITKIQANL